MEVWVSALAASSCPAAAAAAEAAACVVVFAPAGGHQALACWTAVELLARPEPVLPSYSFTIDRSRAFFIIE